MAQVACALTKTGADIVDRTARKVWSAGGASGSGYLDANTNRAFGYGEWGTRGGLCAFYNWAVSAAGDRSNPFRHAYHPDHDGLLWDFSTPAPSGDVWSNYVSTVKPETFSVSNVLTLTWSDDASAIAIWDPSNKLEGTCRWSLTGLRRQAAINVDGTFVMQRVCTAGAIIP